MSKSKTDRSMNPDIRPWYHLLYITEQIKGADQKAYISVAVVCAVTGFCHLAFSRVIKFIVLGEPGSLPVFLLSLLLIICVGGLIGTFSEFYAIIFPKVRSEKYLEGAGRSAIFWYDVAKMSFEEFRNQYLTEDREDDLIVQLYVLSKIAEIKYGRIKRLYTITLFTIIFDLSTLGISKILR